MKKCPKCGQELPDAARFCMGCGSALPENTTKNCPNCGFEGLPKEAAFCPNCGKELTQNYVEMPTQTPQPALQPVKAKSEQQDQRLPSVVWRSFGAIDLGHTTLSEVPTIEEEKNPNQSRIFYLKVGTISYYRYRNRFVYDSACIDWDSPMPEQLKIMGCSWDLSYNQWKALLEKQGAKQDYESSKIHTTDTSGKPSLWGSLCFYFPDSVCVDIDFSSTERNTTANGLDSPGTATEIWINYGPLRDAKNNHVDFEQDITKEIEHLIENKSYE